MGTRFGRVRGVVGSWKRRGAHFACALVVLATIGCSSKSDEPKRSTSSPATGVEEVTLDSFGIFASGTVRIGEGAIVEGGNVGAANRNSPAARSHAVEVRPSARVDTARGVFGDLVVLSKGAVVGDVHTDELVDLGATHGDVLELPRLPDVGRRDPFRGEGPPILIPGDKKSELAPGEYDTISVAPGGTLELTGGTYIANRIEVGVKGRLYARSSSLVVLGDQLTLDDKADLAMAPSAHWDETGLRVAVLGGDSDTSAFRTGPKATVEAIVYVPNGTVEVGENSKFVGAILAQEVDIGSGTHLLTCDGSDATCDSILNEFPSVLQAVTDTGVRVAGCVSPACPWGPATNPCDFWLDPDCYPGFGSCERYTLQAGASCADGNLCNGDETCGDDGLCQAGTPVTFSPSEVDQDPCTLEYCDPETGEKRVNECSTPDDPSVATSVYDTTKFLYAGADAVQTGLDPNHLDKKRTAVVRGVVLDRNRQPLPHITVRVLGERLLGETMSRLDGRFDMVVNGGGQVTVVYEAPGYLPIHRAVDVPWQDYVEAPPVVMTKRDPVGVTVSMDSATTQVAALSEVEDSSGRVRRPTLMFLPGTTAYIPGRPDVTLDELTVHVTEYTIEDTDSVAMPAELPEAVAYTYCVETDADEILRVGSREVSFSQPVVMYVDNFLQLPVGTEVPLGSYDRDDAQWTPAANGRVVEVSAADGTLSGIEAKPATGAPAITVSAEERAAVANQYTAGKQLWRLELTHFSTWDANMGFGPPDGAGPPPPPGPDPDDPLPNPCEASASKIECQNQILRKEIPVVGTPYSLHYASDRVPGRKVDTLSVSVPDPGFGGSASIEMWIAGQHFVHNGTDATFKWDGRDAYGRVVQGWQRVEVEAHYDFPAVYAERYQFGSVVGATLAGNTARASFVYSSGWSGIINGWDARDVGLGGWTLTPHHFYDARRRTVYLGNGERYQADPVLLEREIQTELDAHPSGLDVAPDGTVYFGLGSDVYALSPDRALQRVAGCGHAGLTEVDESGNLLPADGACLWSAEDVALGPDGSLFIADWSSNKRIRRVRPDGKIETVAGGGTETATNACPQRGILATSVPLDRTGGRVPSGLAVGADGSVYVALDDKVCRLSPDGIWYAFAGGDGIDLGLDNHNRQPTGLDVGPDGSVYISSRAFVHRIRPDGTDEVIAGGSTHPVGSDGTPAAETLLGDAEDLAVAPDGTIYFAENRLFYYRTIRKISPEGIISTVDVGTVREDSGSYSYLFLAEGLGLSPDGALLFGSSVAPFSIQRIGPPMPGLELLGLPLLTGEWVSSADGREAYLFDRRGKHLATRDTLAGLAQGALKFLFVYNESGQLDEIRDGDGLVTTIIRDSTSDLPSKIRGPFGQETIVSLDANGYLRSVANPEDEKVVIDYDANGSGLLEHFTNARNYTKDYVYDSVGRLIEQRDPQDLTGEDPSLDPGGRQTFTRTPLPGGHQVERMTQLGRTTTYAASTLPTGSQRTNTFPSTLSSSVSRTPDGVVATTLPNGVTSSQIRASDPRFGLESPYTGALSIATPAGVTFSQARDRDTVWDGSDIFSLTQQTDTVTINNRVVKTAFDAAAQTFTTATPASRETVSTIDAQGRILSVVAPGTAPVSMSYDLGRLKEVIHGTVGQPSARTQKLEYYAINGDPRNGFHKSIQDALGRTTIFSPDGVGRVLTTTFPNNAATVTYGYDESGNLTTIVPPGRNPHSFVYNRLNQLASYVPPQVDPPLADVTIDYFYNADRQLRRVKLPDARIVSLGYDSAGRVDAVEVFSSDVLTASLGLVYDPATGQLAGANGPYGAQSLRYDHDGHLLTALIWGQATGAIGDYVAGSVTFEHTSDFLLKSETVKVGGVTSKVDFRYDDPDGLLTAVGTDCSDPSTASSTCMTLSLEEDSGRLSGTALDSIIDNYTYNAFGELATYSAGHGSTPLLSITYDTGEVSTGAVPCTSAGCRDKLGRIVKKTEVLPQSGTHVWQYEYDPNRDWLIKATHVYTDDQGVEHTEVFEYGYDANGNRNRFARSVDGTEVESVPTTSITVDAQDRLTAYGSWTFDYGANGELQTATHTDGREQTYRYDPLSNLLRYTSTDLPDSITYLVDGMGRRVGKKVGTTLVRQWLYRDDLRIVAELDGAGSPLWRFVYADGTGAEEEVIGNLLMRLGLPSLGGISTSGTRLVPTYAIKDPGTASVRVYRILTDQLGSPRVIADAETGLVAQELNYTPFGQVDVHEPIVPIGFGGGLYDPDSGLVRFGARDYDPSVARWHTKDATRFRGGMNFYAFAGSDPVNHVDVAGYQPGTPHCIACLDEAQRVYRTCLLICKGELPICSAGAGASEQNRCAQNCDKEFDKALEQCRQHECRER